MFMEKSTKRAAIFAHYSENNQIEDYVVFYLENLKKIADFVIFVSDSAPDEAELLKISPYVDKIIAKPHGEYDFGSYKRGYFYLKEKGLLGGPLAVEHQRTESSAIYELILANDSCYAPLFPFENMFSEIEKSGADFWGNTQNRITTGKKQKNEHIQSYFLVFREKVFNSKAFDDFMSNIKKENSKQDVIDKYEIGLSKSLQEAGFKYDAYCNLSKIKNDAQLRIYASIIKKDHSPFLKRGLVLFKFKDWYPFFIKKLIKTTKYDYSLIKKDIRKNRIKLSLPEFSCFFLKSLFRTIKYRVIEFCRKR